MKFHNLLYHLSLFTYLNGRQTVFTPPISSNYQPKNIAIIGGGAGGTSAAYYLSELQNRIDFKLNVDLYETTDRIGGRAYPIFVKGEKFEMGAGCFVDVNLNIQEACKKFNIEKVNLASSNSSFGLYDGSEFVFTYDNSYWSQFKFYYRYGYGYYKTQQLSNKLRDQFLELYKPDTPGFNSIEELLTFVDLANYTQYSNREFLINEVGVSPIFVDEFYQAITRNIYSIPNTLHVLAGSTAFVGTSSREAIKDGNDLLFQAFLKHSIATPYLNSKVTAIIPVNEFGSKTKYQLEINENPLDTLYDMVILATPLHLSNIDLPKEIIPDIEIEYKNVYTMVLTNVTLNPAYFHVKSVKELPETIFGYTPKSSFSVVSHSEDTVSISSVEPITNEFLNKLINATIGLDQIHRKNWKAYPIMKPRKRFPPVLLHDHIYYVNAMEPAISTMETETVSSKNIVKLIEENLIGEWEWNSKYL